MDPYRWGAACALMVITMLTCCSCQTEEDEKRPYKFAFAIEGYQHRSEEKDERGIIMGEFGFVTGDGVYHVTVYATDENGDFKILSMKNYYVGLPGEGTTAAPSRAPPPTARTTPPPRTTPPISTTRSPILQHLDGLKGCSSCVIPDKKKNGQSPRIPSGPTDGGALIGAGPGPSVGKPSLRPSTGTPLTPGAPARGGVNPAYGQRPGGLPAGGAQNALGGSGPTSGVSGQAPSGGRQPGGGQSQYNRPPGGQSQGIAQKPSGGVYAQPPSTAGGPGAGSDRFGGTPSNQGGGPSGRPQPQAGTGGASIPGPNKPNKTIPTYSEGLPPGMTMEDLMALLYKFNYTLRYHGHHESGYRNGDKEGGYFFNGRDGLGRNVKYIANEFGFQPNITLVDLGLQSPDTPQEENEEPNEIKGNEFKWFYKR